MALIILREAPHWLQEEAPAPHWKTSREVSEQLADGCERADDGARRLPAPSLQLIRSRFHSLSWRAFGDALFSPPVLLTGAARSLSARHAPLSALPTFVCSAASG